MDFKCKCCGKCCSNFLPLREEEIRIMKKIAKEENIKHLRNDWYSICPFLNNSNRCDIYEKRPFICREYSCYNFENKIFNLEKFKNITKEEFKLVDIRKEIFNRK